MEADGKRELDYGIEELDKDFLGDQDAEEAEAKAVEAAKAAAEAKAAETAKATEEEAAKAAEAELAEKKRQAEEDARIKLEAEEKVRAELAAEACVDGSGSEAARFTTHMFIAFASCSFEAVSSAPSAIWLACSAWSS